MVVTSVFSPKVVLTMIELTSKQLRRAADLQDKIETLQSELAKLLGSGKIANGSPTNSAAPKKRTMSAAARKKIAAAQKTRWAKVKAGKK
jgi:DNA-binding PucR family transcriptional regulator